MSALARIKKTAAQHEQERQYDKALALYARILDGAEAGEEEVDVGLFNRAGDLALRLGDAPRAVGYFERALDLYASGGLLNNAVALGVKILRHAPNHLSAHYTLGVLYGRKGFAGDARHHMLTYAVQMQRAGRADEADRVLAEVAAGCGDPTARRLAMDAYGALGGDPERAGALAGGGAVPPLPASAPGAATPAAASLVVADGLSMLDLSVPDAGLASPASEPAWETPEGDLRAVVPAPEAEPPAWAMLELDPAPTTGPAVDFTPEADAAELWAAPVAYDATAFDTAPHSGGAHGAGSSLTFLDVGADFGDDGPMASEPGAASAAPALGTPDALLDFTGDLAPAQAASAARWTEVLPDEPPPLRLAELRDAAVAAAGYPVAVVPTVELFEAAKPVGASTPADPAADYPLSLAPLAADSVPGGTGRYADLLAMELGAAAPDASALTPAAVDAVDAAPPIVFRAADESSEPEVVAPAAEPARHVPPAAPATEAALDLGAWLRETIPAESTRLTTADVPQTGDEQADFDATLRAFTAGVARVVEHEDYDSHYDLGVAFREMGLLDEAIIEFQRAARAPGRPLRTLEALAQCFLDTEQPELALTTLAAPVADAAAAGVGDASLVAVHYLMGAAAQATGRRDDARRWLVRVVAADVRFRDAASRLAALPPPLPV